jgi:hypothetical protein
MNAEEIRRAFIARLPFVTSKGKSLAAGQTKFTASMVKGIEKLRASLEPDVCLLQEVDVGTG